jgi:ABC-type transport system involved in cytochrome bd biosynthesis fused ATPase/permease subunit
VAISGPSGSGKSTLLMAVLGLLPVDQGAIAVAGSDGQESPLDEFDPAAWRRQLAWVPQAPYLVPGTVADNIRLIAPEASDATVVEALAAVGLGHVDPYQVLGDRGVGLSSGERRRVAVARALARGPGLLLVDEPTAGLDDETEQLVLAAIEREARTNGAMVLLVAHRASAVAIADREVQVAARSATVEDGIAAA